MTEPNEVTDASTEPKKRGLKRRLFSIFGAIVVLFIVVVTGFAVWLDTDQGHRFVVDQVEALEREDGLSIDIGAIEGSIYGKTRIADLELGDPKGIFFRAGNVTLDWRPLAWIFNELSITSAVISDARLERFPELVATDDDSALLPAFDIYIGSFRAKELVIGEAVAGEEQQADLDGAIDIRSGRAMVNIDAATTRSGDRLALNLNAEPDRSKLDIDADIVAPAGGVLAGYLGLEADMAASITGDGDWEKWDGELVAESGGVQVAGFTINARDGLFGYDGDINDDLLPGGLLRRIAAPRLVVAGNMEIDDGLAQLDLTAQSPAIQMTAKGRVDLSAGGLDALRVETRMRDPSALIANMRADDLELKALLNGRFADLRYQYLLTAPQLAFGNTVLSDVKAEGNGARDGSGWNLPLEIAINKVAGGGPLIERLTAGLTADAFLRVEDGLLFSERASIAGRAVKGQADVNVNLSTGDYAIGLDAQAPQFAVEGVGIVDLVAALGVTPNGNRIGLSGQATARLRRFDNAFLRDLGGGLPVVKSGLELTPEGLLRFTNLDITVPKLQFSGGGAQKGGGAYSFDGRGRHDQYGAFDLSLNGPLNRPQIALLLDDPFPAAGLANVRVNLDPRDDGFGFQATGGSTLGPFNGNGAIVTARGSETLVRVERLLVSNTVAKGIVRPTAEGLAGRLDISGGGLTGDVMFEPGTARQLIRADLTAKNTRFDGVPPIFIRTGKLDADIVLVDGRSDIKATLRAQGISRGELVIGRIAGNANLSAGRGDATFSIAGTRGSTFDFQAQAKVQTDRYLISGRGNFQGRAIRLSRALDLRRSGDGWSVAPTTLRYGSGSAQFSGRLGDDSSRIDMRLSKMPLSLIDIAYPDLGLGGLANGTINLSQSGSSAPTGDAKLNIRGLTRSGLILTSTPVDLGLNMAMSSRNAAARGVIKNKAGNTIGRFQGRVTGLDGGSWTDDLMRKPLFAQARFNGAAESLWRLTGVETFDLTGPVAMSADVGGTLANPQIRGSLRISNARLESGLTGTVITGIRATGSFDGSRLVMPNVTGQTKRGGSVSGSGSFNFAAEPGVGVGITMDLNAQKAVLIDRDDFAATVSGPIKIRNTENGGLISGDVTLNRSFFRFGRASAIAALPQVKVREINRRADERPPRVRTRPWRFALKANAPNRLMVDGLGLDSEWRANLGISGSVDNFAITGDADMLRGNYTFAGRRFRLERGRIRFVGNQPSDPILNIAAEANLAGLNATINVTGSGNRPEIAFNSVPALPQDELLSRILFGESIANLSAPEAVQLAAAVASLNNGGGLDPINQLRRAAGLDRLRILPSDTQTGQSTSVAAGKYITRRTYVELITDGKGYSATRLEFQITRWLSILSSISTLGRQSANVRVSRDY